MSWCVSFNCFFAACNVSVQFIKAVIFMGWYCVSTTCFKHTKFLEHIFFVVFEQLCTLILKFYVHTFIYKLTVYISSVDVGSIWTCNCCPVCNITTSEEWMLNVEGLMKLVPHTSVRNVSGNNTQLLKNVIQ